MNKFFFTLALTLCSIMAVNAQIKGQEMEKYRRSSLNMICLEDPRVDPAVFQYVRDAFLANPMPAKYNDHAVDAALRIVSMNDIEVGEADYAESLEAMDAKKKKDGVKGAKTAGAIVGALGALAGQAMGPSNEDLRMENLEIDTVKRWIPHVAHKYFKDTNMAKLVVDKWFGVESGKINLDLVRERAMLNATEMEKKIAEESSDLSVESYIMDNGGLEVIGNTFVTISRFRLLTAEEMAAEIVENAAIAANFLPQQLADAAITAAEIPAAAIIATGGTFINTNTYLFRLVWNDEVYAHINSCANDIDKYNALDLFKLEFIGQENAHASTTVGGKKRTEEEGIKYATARALDKVLAKLEKEYEVFRTKVPLIEVDPVMKAEIGTKECVEKGDKYEILEKVMKLDKETNKYTVDYKRVGVITVDEVGNNMGENNDDENASSNTYTTFKGKAPKNATKGMLIRYTKGK